MKRVANRFYRRWSKPFVLALALLSLVFLLQVSTHGHADGQDEAACRLCVAPAVAAITFTLPLIAVGRVLPATTPHQQDSFLGHSSSRAPPSRDL
jgi:hypothetical protein